MKKILLLLSFKYMSSVFGQTQMNPIVVIDSKKLGFMNDFKKEMEAIDPNDVSTVSVYKDSLISKKYGSEKGVIIITTKKYILETFFKEFIENSPIKEKIATTEILSKIRVVNGDSKSKNQPYDELTKYIFTNTNNERILKIAKITFIEPAESIKINEKWVDGAIEISSIPGE